VQSSTAVLRLNFCAKLKIFASIAPPSQSPETLEFDYGDDPAEPTVEIGVLKIVHKNKDILIGNTKTSYKLFNEIRQTVLRHAVLADT
jgi:hypothetical protein